MPSFTYRLVFGVPYRRCEFDSFSVNNASRGDLQYSQYDSILRCVVLSTVPASSERSIWMRGLALSGNQVQSSLNHRVGNTCRVAATGPRLTTLIRIRLSCG